MSEEIPQGFVSVGLDCHKKQHTIAILDRDGRLVGQRKQIPITIAGFEHARELILAAKAGCNAETVRIGVEAASFYHLNITDFLQPEFPDLQVFNPKLLGSGQKRRDIRNKKNDKQDALNLAWALREGVKGSMPYRDLALMEIQELCRIRSRLTKNKVNLMKRFRRNLDVLFPGLDQRVKPWSRVWNRFLVEYPSAETVRKANVEQIAATTLAGGTRGMRRRTIEAVIELANRVPDCRYYRESLVIEQGVLLKDILLLGRQIKSLSKEALARWRKLAVRPCFFDMDGLDEEDGIALYSEMGPLERFAHSDKLVAFFGLDPRTKRSGDSVTYGRLTKMGTRYGREYLGNMVATMKKSNPTIRAAWEKAVGQGRPKKVCRVITMRKLARIIWGIEHSSNPNITD
jgi:transposase